MRPPIPYATRILRMKRALQFVAPVAAAAVLALGLVPALAQSTGGQVKVQTLTAPDPEGFGLLQPPEGFAPDLWQDTPRPLVENLLPRIPDAGTSRALTIVLPPGEYQLICPIPGHERIRWSCGDTVSRE